MRITFLHTMTVGGLGPSFSLYVWSNTSSSVSRSGCHIGDLISLSGMMTTANTHTRFCYYNTRKSNSGCSRSRSENKVRHISVTHQRSFGKKHSQNCCGWMWIQREGVKAASEQEYPNAWNSTACKQLLTENTQKYCAVIGQFDGTLKRALRLAEVHLMFAFSLFSDTSIPVQPNSTGAGAFIPYTISPHRRGVPLLQPITENYRNAFAISTISSFHTTSCFSHLICSSIITLYCT